MLAKTSAHMMCRRTDGTTPTPAYAAAVAKGTMKAACVPAAPNYTDA